MNSHYVIKWTSSPSNYKTFHLTSSKYIENKNTNTLQENIINLQKQLMVKDKIIRPLI